MHSLVWFAILAAFVFLLTYDPRSQRLNKYIPSKDTPCAQCESGRYQELQFNTRAPNGGCNSEPKEFMGAVI
jgi:hypothetical protein